MYLRKGSTSLLYVVVIQSVIRYSGTAAHGMHSSPPVPRAQYCTASRGNAVKKMLETLDAR